MLFLFLALYVALGIGCVVAGVRRHSRVSVILGTVTLVLAAASLAAGALYALGATHWSVSLLQMLLSPMPESLVQPDSFADAAPGVPSIVIAATELIVAIGLWAIPVLGLVSAGRAPRRPGV
jgi:hypothetical protein